MAANSLAYSQIIGIPLVLVIGFLFDIMGRRVTTCTAFVVGSISTFLIPIVSPSLIGYDLARIFFCETMVVVLANPFINDYVTV